MLTDDSTKTITDINLHSLGEATETLARAFEEDPVIKYFLSGHKEKYAEKARGLFRYQCYMHIEMGLPVFGTVRDSVITGVACLSFSGKKKRPDSLLEADRRFELSVGPDTFSRIKKYSKLNKKYLPEKPHYYLGALGVHPDYQGLGFARILLDKAHAASEEDELSTGVYLETARLNNVEMYEHFGYKQIGKEKLDNIVDIWYLFRPAK